MHPATEDHPVEIQATNLHKAFGDNVVLRGIDLTIRQGEIATIVGGSGCGKTVLLELLTGQMAPDTGQVCIADHEVAGAPLIDINMTENEVMDQIRVHWSIVFQRNALFSGTVHENIALWLREVRKLDEQESLRIASESLEAVSLDPAEVMELQRDELSGGMAKRVAIARAIAMDPALIFYDEPTTGLDPHHAGLIHELIGETHWRPTSTGLIRTTVVITHDKDLLRRLQPRVIMLNEGSVFFDGTYEDFAESTSDVIRPYFELMPVLQRRPR